MSEELKNSPVENFDWDAFEKGEVYGDKSHDELVNTYDQIGRASCRERV